MKRFLNTILILLLTCAASVSSQAQPSAVKTYGSVGAVIIVLLWLYITGFSIMLGGAVNSDIGRAVDAQMLRTRGTKIAAG
jgi:uncharacterized BrkB/YihY/UPF0761 family membrane protein